MFFHLASWRERERDELDCDLCEYYTINREPQWRGARKATSFCTLTLSADFWGFWQVCTVYCIRFSRDDVVIAAAITRNAVFGRRWKLKVFFLSSRQHKLGKASNRTHTLIGRLTMMIGSKVSSTSTTCHRQAFKVVHLSITEKKLLLFCLRVSEFSKWNFNELKLYCVLVFLSIFPTTLPSCLPLIIITVIISPLWIRKSA